MSQLMQHARRRLLVSTVVAASLAAATVGVAAAGASSARPASHPSGLAVAKSQLAPYTNKFPKFPITQKLKTRPPSSDTVDYLQCGASQCATFGGYLATAVAALGLHFTVISAGLFPSTAQAAASTALADHPSAVIVAGLALSDFGNGLKAIEKAGIPILGIGTDNGPKYGLKVTLGSNAQVSLAGELMADWVLVHKGAKADVTFFGTPELDFSPVMWGAFDKQLKKICPKCKVAESQISVLDFGSTAPSLVVNYLRAHTAVNTIVFAADPAADGLPAALAEASLTPTIFGWNPDDVGLGDIQAGTETGAIGLDTLTSCWQVVDIMARILTKQAFPASEETGVIEVLTKTNVTSGDVSNGWGAYPNAGALTEKLWPPA
jgi:ribose transport system substrate-binding protein